MNSRSLNVRGSAENLGQTRSILISGLSCLSLFLAAALATGCGHSSTNSGLTKVTLQADWYPQPEHGGFYAALVKGYYKDEGLDLTIQPGSQYMIPDQQV